MLKREYAVKRFYLKGNSSGKIYETSTEDGVHFTFNMPDEGVSIYTEVGIFKRLSYELIHCTSSNNQNIVFPGDEISFTLYPEEGGYEYCYVLSDDVTLNQDPENKNKYSFIMPDKNVLVKGVYLLHNHIHDGKTFFVWDQPDKVPAIDGSFALGADVTLEKSWIQKESFDVCLNGHTFSCKSAIQVDKQKALNIYDCSDSGSGKIVSAGSKLAINASSGTMNMYGGTITGFDTAIITSNGHINIFKGTVSTTGIVFSLGRYSSLTVGSESDSSPSSVFISGELEYRDGTKIKLNSGFYDERAYDDFGYYRGSLFPEGKGFIETSEYEGYSFTVGNTGPFKITIVSDGNGTVTSYPDSSAKTNETVTLTVSSDEGYELDSLTVKDKDRTPISVTDNKFTMPAKDVTVEANFKKITYNITYDLNGGTLHEGETNPTKYSVDSENITLINPSKEHNTFLGWTGTETPNPSTNITIPKGSTGDREYTANWETEKYLATFYAEDGTTILQSSKVPYGTVPSYTGSTPAKESTAQY